MRYLIITVLFVFLFAAVSCSSASGEKPAAALNGNVLVFIPSKDVQDTEFLAAKKALTKAGLNVTVVNLEGKTANGMLGGAFKPDIKLADVKTEQYKMLTFIGGTGSFDLFDNTDVHKLVKEFCSSGKFVSAICASSGILANAGILNGVDATCYPAPSVIKLLKNGGANYLKKSVVVSDKIITGNGPDASNSFADALVDALKG